MIQDVFRAEGLPLDLAYVPLVESAFQVGRPVAREGEGMWQFMRSTGLRERPEERLYIDERAEPEKATRAAAKVPQDSLRHVRRLAPGARLLQRRPAGYRAPFARSAAQGFLVPEQNPAGTSRGRHATTSRSFWRR